MPKPAAAARPRLLVVEDEAVVAIDVRGHLERLGYEVVAVTDSGEDACRLAGELASGEIEGDKIVCPRHGAVFCIRTGEVLEPPAYESVATFPVREEDGRVLVRDDRWD